jgi:beta-lactam-binding protein with PASTA domain
MRTCQSCGLENPPDRDFCECGEYLRWDPTGFVQAVTPEMLQQAAEQAPPAAPAAPGAAAPGAPAEAGGPESPAPAAPAQPPQGSAPAAPPPAQVTPAAPPPAPDPAGGNGSSLTTGDPLGGSPPPPPAAPPVPHTAQQPAVAVPPPAPPVSRVPEEPDPAMITLRLPDRDASKEQTLATAVEPGQRERILGLVRNQSGIVDNYELRVEGLPDDWWSIFPDTVYLVPFGTGGTYEQEVEIHIHPPRSPEAEAKLWQLKVVAHSKAHSRDAATAPFVLAIQAYTETTTKVRPERAKGRRKAEYDIAVENKANAPVLVALEGSDADGELVFGFNRPPQEVPPGATVQTGMQVRPPKQMWIGRPLERRFEVVTLTGDEAAERLAEEPVSAEALADQPAAPPKRGLFRRRSGTSVPGVYGPRVYKPQVHAPGLSLGPGGINFRAPQFRGPSMAGPQAKGMNLDMAGLKGKMGRPGGGAAAPAGPLLPSQGAFRQKPWLPWWLIPVGIALAALAIILYMLLPKNVVVPDLVGSESAFAAEEKLTDAKLKLASTQKERVAPDATPGSVIGQTPAAGEKAEKDSEVSLLIATGNGKVTVPDITGKTLSDAEKALRGKKLSLGAASPSPADPEGKISSQIPAAKEIVKEGTPIDIFYPDPNGEKDGGKKGGAAAPGAAGGGAAKEIVIPAIGDQDTTAFAQKMGDDGLVPEMVRSFDESKAGTLYATEPPGGTKVKAGTKVKLLVSAGFPQLAFDDDKNIRLLNGATGKALDPIAKGPQREKDPAWSADGTRVAYVAAGRVFLKNMTKPDEAAIPLTGTGEEFGDLAWAPTADLNLVAMSRVKGADRDLCLGEITGDGMVPRCISEPGFNVGRSIHWAPDGKAIFGFAVKAPGQFGIVRWRSKKPFSPDTKDWGKGRFVTDMAETNKGVLDAALSPDGKQLALVANVESDFFRLYLAKPNDFPLTNAKATAVRACKVTWRSDGRELALVQADEACQEDVGSLVRLEVSGARKQTALNASGDNPVYQPLTLGG